MAYRKKRSNTETKPLTLSDGTEVYEVSESFSVNSLIDISFSRTRPVRSRHQAEYLRLDGHIVEEAINTERAKLKYIGCTLIPPDKWINKAINESFNKRKESTASAKPYTVYNKLLNDLSRFAQDLQKYDSNDPADERNVKLLTAGINRLNETLKAIGKDSEYQPILQRNYSSTDATNHALNKIITKVSETETEAKHSETEEDVEDRWYLYHKNKGAQAMGTSDFQLLALESRISKMENCVGFVSDMSNPYPDTLNAVDLLESRFEYVFGSSWINIKQKANAMTNDLKNIKYHLDLMQARYKPTEKQTRMEWEKLEDLWIVMNKWDKVVFQLINIVKRLKSLQNYHYRTCLFIKRVNKIYDEQCFIYQSLKNDEKTLRKCLQSME
eukprot:256498_1